MSPSSLSENETLEAGGGGKEGRVARSEKFWYVAAGLMGATPPEFGGVGGEGLEVV